MSDKSAATLDTLIKLPEAAKKALKVYAAETDSTMEVAGGILVVTALQEKGRLPKSALQKNLSSPKPASAGKQSARAAR
jgi:repressor of nif and glnA expression